MRKIRIQITAVILMMCCLICGCSEEKQQKQEKLNQEEVTIRWMVFGEKFKSSDSVIAAFNKELKRYLPGTTVEFEIVPLQSYQDKWNRKMSTSEVLDLVWIGNDIFNYTEEVKKGGFMALDYLISTNGTALMKEIPEELWEMQKRDGKIYSVPLMGALYRKDYALVTSKSNMESCGNQEEIARVNQESIYTDESCFQVIGDYLKNLKETQKIGTGVSCDTFSAIAQKGYEGIYGPESPFVIRIFDEKLKVYNKYELDSYKSYFQAMSEWYDKGYIRQDVEEVLDPEVDNGTKTGNAVFLDEYGENGVVLDQISTEYEAVRIPLQNYKYKAYESCRNAIAIPRTTENPQRAMEIINLLNSREGKELARILCNGFEGRHYVKTGDGRTDRVTDKNGKAIYSLSPYAVGNVFLNYETVEGEFEQLRTYNEEAVSSPLTGFELDTRMIVLEMEKIDLVADQYIDTLERGTSKDWEETYREMLDKMREAGADKVISEMQKQIDRFTEENMKDGGEISQ